MLDSNLFTGPIPTEVSSLTKLEELVLADNVLTGTVSGHLCGTFSLS